MAVKRFDRVEFTEDALAKPVVTPEGFWKVQGRLARTGIQEYHRADGSVIKELRKPEDVQASVPGFALAPLTNQHPPAMVTPENAKQYVCGAIGEAKFDGKWVMAPITVYDQSTIDAIKAGRVQVSAGYSCEVVVEQGEWEGERYDSRQTGIQINHVAMVDVARAGNDARIRLDSADAVDSTMRFLKGEMPVLVSNREDNRMDKPHTFKLDGLDIQVADPNHEALINRALKERTDRAEKAEAESAAKDEVIKQLKEEKAATPMLIEKRADEIASIRELALKHLGTNWHLNGKDETTLKRAIIKQHLPKYDGVEKLEGPALEAALAAALSVEAEKPAAPVVKADAVVGTDAQSAQQRMIERNRAAWIGNKEQK